MIKYSQQYIDEEDLVAVTEVLKSELITQGNVVREFEHSVSSYVGAKYGVAANSATSALHVALVSMGVGKGDWVWTSPNTFVATANAVLTSGARVDFIDIDLTTYNISTEALREKLEIAERRACIPKVVIAVDFAGLPCDYEALKSLSEKYNFKILSDSSHALGARYKGIEIGHTQHSDVCVFSFHPVKMITTGEGGMIVTDNKLVAERSRAMVSHGIARSTDHGFINFGLGSEIINYSQVALGNNYRMSEINAALGLSQIKKLDGFCSQRQAIAEFYCQQLVNLPVQLPYRNSIFESSYHLFSIRLLPNSSDNLLRNKIYEDGLSKGIGYNIHYIPVYLQPFYQKQGFKRGYCPNAEKYFLDCLSIPLHQKLDFSDQHRVIEHLSSWLQ